MSDDLDLAALDDAVVLVTGGTSGVGREGARRLAERGATVLVHGRDRERGEAVADELTDETPGEGRFLRADFADLGAVSALADRVRESHDRLDVLANNAGLYADPERRSEQGHELTIAVNHFAPYLLTRELAPRLVESEGRVVVTASTAHYNGRITADPADLASPARTGWRAYARSKLANVLFTRELARRLAGTGVTANSFHPGVIPGSGFGRDLPGPLRLGWEALGLVPGVTDSPADGGRALAHLAASPAVADVTGGYFHETRERSVSRTARDDDLARRLWVSTAEVVDVGPELPVAADGA